MPKHFLHIALIQTDLVWENVDANLLHLEKLVTHISSETELVILPEMFSTGFSMKVEEFAEPMDGKTVSWMKDKSKLLGMVICGSLMIREDGLFYNRFVFVRPTGELEYYDKRHLFSMGEENIHFSSGTERKVFQLKNFRILPQICYDLRFPVFSRNRGDYDLLINSANWPAPRKEVWKTLLKARAIENQAYVAGVNRIGIDANGIRYSGDSLIIDPKGKEMSVGKPSKEEILTARLSKDTLDKFRLNFQALDDADNFELY